MKSPVVAMKQYAFFQSLLSIFLFACGILSAPGALASQAAAPKRAFDVATVKLSAPLDPAQLAADMRAGRRPRIGPQVDASRAGYYYLTLKQLIAIAYQVKDYQIDGPDWLGTERFDIEGTYPEGATRADAPAMLQSLLEERFKLTVHRDTADHKVLALIVGKNGPKMTEATTKPQPIDPNAPLQPGETKMDLPDGPAVMKQNKDGSMTMNMGEKGTLTYKFDGQQIHMESSNTTMTGFADTLTSLLRGLGGQPVVDMTGLKGYYAVAVNLTIADMMAMAKAQGFGAVQGEGAANTEPTGVASDPAGVSVYQSVEKMGLKLEERKAPVEQLVIDHIEKMPTEN